MSVAVPAVVSLNDEDQLHVCELEGLDRKNRFIGKDSFLTKMFPIKTVFEMVSVAGVLMGAYRVQVYFPEDGIRFTIQLPDEIIENCS